MAAHIKLGRKGTWLYTWSNLPGQTCDAGRKVYHHQLLPGWEYTAAEMQTEMIDDLEHFAATGEQPKAATTNGQGALKL